MSIRTLAVALALAAAPAPVLAQQQPAAPLPAAAAPGARRQHPRPRRDAVSALLRHRQQLGLSADQVSRLQAIRRRTRSQNQPLVQQIRDNEKAARQEAAAVLTAQQKQRIESLRAANRANRGGGR
ncbi:MAG TPA: hypothetical protein VFL93_00865 [Longimicrobiaceae bacterium]|nr:hypothetical protein [Longimicrobiaceae bacterium]